MSTHSTSHVGVLADDMSSDEKNRVVNIWRTFINACRPYRNFQLPLKIKYFAENSLDGGYESLLIFNDVAGIAVAKEMCMRLMQLIEIVEGRIDQRAGGRSPIPTSDDPFRYAIPAFFRVANSMNIDEKLVWKTLHDVLCYMVVYNKPDRLEGSVEDGLNKVFAIAIREEMLD